MKRKDGAIRLFLCEIFDTAAESIREMTKKPFLPKVMHNGKNTGY